MKREVRAFGFANLVSAFGGGAVLGRGIGLIDVSGTKLGSLAAFFLGSLIGLGVLFGFLNRKSSTRELLSILLGPVFSVLLLVIVELRLVDSSNDGFSGVLGAVFFLVLSLRFAFWFLSRILRSDRVSEEDPGAIPFVEGLFHTGTILSLAIVASNLIPLPFETVLIVDIFCQVVGVVLDYKFSGRRLQSVKNDFNDRTALKFIGSWSWLKPIVLFSLLTILVQVVIFHVSYIQGHTEGAGTLTAFYFGLAISGMCCSHYGVSYLEYGTFGHIRIGRENRFVEINNGILVVLCILLTLTFLFSLTNGGFVGYIFIFLSSFTFEITCFGLIDLIGKRGSREKVEKSVAKSFGAMALLGCISMIFLRTSSITLTGSLFVVGLLGGVCLFLLKLTNQRGQTAH